jgi:hypothetical protein
MARDIDDSSILSQYQTHLWKMQLYYQASVKVEPADGWQMNTYLNTHVETYTKTNTHNMCFKWLEW